MLSSMFSGVSGLTAHQKMMDVIGNNIANVNTTAFQRQQRDFPGAFLPDGQGSIQTHSRRTRRHQAPQQIGLGVEVGSIAVQFKSGSIQSTTSPSDLALDGDGFFVVSDGTAMKYTRAGNFTFDVDNNLVASNGARVMGWNLGKASSIDMTQPLQAISLANITMPASATKSLTMTGNINSNTEVYDLVNDKNYIQTNLTIYDSLGESHSVTFKIMKSAANNYNYSILESDAGHVDHSRCDRRFLQLHRKRRPFRQDDTVHHVPLHERCK